LFVYHDASAVLKIVSHLLVILKPQLLPAGPGGQNYVSPILKLCLGLHCLSIGIYLDLSFAYEMPYTSVHFYIWQDITAIDNSSASLIEKIYFPTNGAEKLEEIDCYLLLMHQKECSTSVST
jgi:hypothetical protein